MLNAIILIGGKSERMGTDKYQLKVHDKPQYIRLYEMLSEEDISPYLSCSKQQFDQIPNDFSKIADRYDGIGPIGGLASAIYHDHKNPILLVACDLINLTKKGIQRLIDQNDDSFDVVTYQKKGTDFKETTLTIYNPTSFSYIKQAVDEREFSLVGILKRCKVKSIDVEDNSVLKNANTRDDLR